MRKTIHITTTGLCIFAFAAFFIAASPVGGFAQADVQRSSGEADEDFVYVNECANNEEVHFVGTFRWREIVVIDPNGMMHYHFTANDNGLTAVGTSGTTYRRVGADTLTYTWDQTSDIPQVYKFVSVMNFIGQGPGNNLVIYRAENITTDANGEIKVWFEIERVECR